jgi:hypothetical protein
LNRNALDLIERNLILPPAIAFRGSRAPVVGVVLRSFKRALVLQVCGDAGSSVSALPSRAMFLAIAMLSSSSRASSAVKTGVLPFS